MRLQNPFALISTTGLDSQVLTVLSRSEQYLTVREIRQLLPEGGSPVGVRDSLDRLVQQGIVVERATGRFLSFSLNGDHLLIEAVRSIAAAKSTLVQRIADTMAGWAVQPVTVTLFGSAARDEMSSESDIDLPIVLPDNAPEDAAERQVTELVDRVSAWTGNETNPLVYRAHEVTPAPVFDSILNDGVPVAGDPNWLRRTLQRRKSAA